MQLIKWARHYARAQNSLPKCMQIEEDRFVHSITYGLPAARSNPLNHPILSHIYSFEVQ